MTSSADLPRLIYVGDVPVEATVHGSAVLYRLLESYPPDRLRVIETAGRSVAPNRRLPGVAYRFVAHGSTRWLNTRLHRSYSLALATRALLAPHRLTREIDGFAPEAVVTLAHGSLWMAAAQFARRQRLPLHIIVHDDRPWLAALPRPVGALVDRRFGRAYRSAASRLVVSPAMAEEYLVRHHAAGEVLYPSRAAGAPVFDAPPPGLHDPAGRIVVAYAGTTEHVGHARLLSILADALAPVGGQLVIFGPGTIREARLAGLDRPNVRLGGMLPSHELIVRLRAEADALFVPMSFAAADRINMTLSFPSKLTDYTAAGLPLLIQGPPECSAVRWAAERRAAEIVTSEDPGRVAAAVARLSGDAEYRRRLGVSAIDAGRGDFAQASAWDRFRAALMRPLAGS